MLRQEPHSVINKKTEKSYFLVFAYNFLYKWLSRTCGGNPDFWVMGNGYCIPHKDLTNCTRSVSQTSQFYQRTCGARGKVYLRWFQMACFLTFCRTHSSNNVEHRTPWTYGEPYLSIIRQCLRSLPTSSLEYPSLTSMCLLKLHQIFKIGGVTPHAQMQ